METNCSHWLGSHLQNCCPCQHFYWAFQFTRRVRSPRASLIVATHRPSATCPLFCSCLPPTPTQDWAFLVVQMVNNLPAMEETWVQSLGVGRGWGGGEDPWRGEWQPSPVFLPGEFHGQRSLAGYSPWGHKERLTICPPGMVARIPGHCLQGLQAWPKEKCPSTEQ